MTSFTKYETVAVSAQDREMVKFVNHFQRKQTKGTIDVWWLFDDGGLTLLLPYILSKKSQWSGCKLRVFVPGDKEPRLDRAHRQSVQERCVLMHFIAMRSLNCTVGCFSFSMATLLSKFRIEYSSMTVVPEMSKPPSTESCVHTLPFEAIRGELFLILYSVLLFVSVGRSSRRC